MSPEVIRAAQNGDNSSMERLIVENSGLIWSVCRRFLGRGVEKDDLYQLGCVGFMKAVMGYDEEYGTQFSTYAVPKIAGEIRRFLRDDGEIKVSRTIKERAIIIKTAQSRLSHELCREPTISEISAETGLSNEDIALALEATATPESLQAEINDGSGRLEDVIADKRGENDLVERVALKEAISSLGDREKKVILLRFYRDLTQEKAASILGISQVQVSRIEKRAINELGQLLA